MKLNVCSDLQTSRHEREEAEQNLTKMTADNAELVQRLVEMKATEVERMNEVNRTCDEMVRLLLPYESSQMYTAGMLSFKACC